MKPFLFDIYPNGRDYLVEIDCTQPYLRDHDVGVPLFGTVLSLEAMAECVAHRQGRVPLSVTQVVAGADCLVSERKTLACTLSHSDSITAAALTDGGALVFSCQIESALPVAPPKREKPEVCSHSASRLEIYRHFFHGPSFQVVERAYVSGACMIGEMNDVLPSLRSDSNADTAIPMRVIEFCLQTAGLLDVAQLHTMSVPLSIDRIEVYGAYPATGIWSIAQKQPHGADIHAYAADGTAVLSVFGYRTKPMPYESPSLQSLCAALDCT